MQITLNELIVGFNLLFDSELKLLITFISII